jgi:hypothetical protein
MNNYHSYINIINFIKENPYVIVEEKESINTYINLLKDIIDDTPMLPIIIERSISPYRHFEKILLGKEIISFYRELLYGKLDINITTNICDPISFSVYFNDPYKIHSINNLELRAYIQGAVDNVINFNNTIIFISNPTESFYDRLETDCNNLSKKLKYEKMKRLIKD